MSCISDKLLKFSIYELLQLHQFVILCCICGYFSIFLIFYIYTNINIPESACAHTQAQTHAHTCKIQVSLKKTPDLIEILTKFSQTKIFALSKKQNDWKMQDEEVYFSEVSCFQPELFQRFCPDFKWLHSSKYMLNSFYEYFSFGSSQ